MSQLKAKFEKDLKSKLLYKTSPHMTEEMLLLKSFIYFDIDRTGQCDADTFFQVMSKVGIFGFTEDEMKQLFNIYSGGQKNLDYKDFIGVVFDNESLKKKKENPEEEGQYPQEPEQGEEPEQYQDQYQEPQRGRGRDQQQVPPRDDVRNRPPQQPQQQQPGEEEQRQEDNEEEMDPIEIILMKLRNLLARRGIENLIGMERDFRELDTENVQAINYNTFKKACNQFNLELTDQEMRDLFDTFDREGTGVINYDEFIRVLRGELSPNRKELVDNIFNNISENKGSLPLEELFKMYVPKGSLEYAYRHYPEDEAMQIFVDTFKDNHLYLHGDDDSGKPADVEEFEDYYESVSAMIPDDELFRDILLKSWGLVNIDEPKKEVPPPKDEVPIERRSDRGDRDQPERMERDNRDRPERPERDERERPGRQERRPEPEQMQEPPEPYDRELRNQRDEPFEEPQENLRNEPEKKIDPYQEQKKKEKEFRKNLLNEQNLDAFRNLLGSRGIRPVMNFVNQLRQYDRKGDKELPYEAFADVINSCNLNMPEDDIRDLFNDFVPKNKKTINYGDFLNALVGELNPRRENVVLSAFKKLDLDKCDVINLADVKSNFNSKNSPIVREGIMTEEDFYNDFMESFQTHHNIFRSPKIKKVNLDEFVDYYKYVSITIEDDYLFEEMLIACWKLSKSPIAHAGPKDNIKELLQNPKDESAQEPRKTAKKFFGQRREGGGAPYGTDKDVTDYSNPLHPKGELVGIKLNKNDDPISLFRKKIISRGLRGLMSLRRTFILYDEKKNNKLTPEQFHKYIEDYRIPLTPNDEEKLFNSFNKDRSGDINYNDLIDAVVGQMNDYRRSIVQQVFEKLDSEKTGKVPYDVIRNTYNPAKHPDVLTGVRSAEEMLSRFIDLFEYHFNLLNQNKDVDYATLQDFIDFYNTISMFIDDDKLFENVVSRVWELNNVINYAKGFRNLKRSYIF